MLALLGPDAMATALLEKAKALDVDLQVVPKDFAPQGPAPAPIMLSGRPGTNRHARRAQAAAARRKR